MKKNLLVVLVLAFALVLSACGSAPAAEAPAEEAPAEEMPAEEMADPFRVAIIMPSSITDLAFSQSMFDALLAVQEEMGGEEAMEIAYSEGMFVVDDAAAAIRDYASEGYDLVIAHGSQYGSSLQEIAPDFPTTAFAHGTTLETFVDEGINNIFAYEADAHEGGFVNGVMAANLTESGVIGVVGPIEAGDAALYVIGFEAGVASVNPDATVNINWIGSFSDVALAAEAANTHVSAGADVMTGTAQMVVGAIGVAEENGALWFGTQASQASIAEGTVVASQIYDWTVVLDEIIANIDNGVYGGEAYTITLANGGLLMDYNAGYDLADDVKAAGDAAAAGIIDGSIEIPVE